MPAAERFQSTYRRAFDQDRQLALARLPPDYLAPGARHPLNSKLKADTYQLATMGEGPPGAGRGGSRGEFTRWPAESGSRYSVSVWADEYSAGRL